MKKTCNSLNPLISNKINNVKDFDIDHNQNLIRIISRFSTLPNFDKIKIKHISSIPNYFKIIPGKEVLIGYNLLKNPIMALFVQRFAIEWQIWYVGALNYVNRTQIADISASLVASNFYQILPESDKLELKKHLPQEVYELMDNILKVEHLDDLLKLKLSYITKFHNQKSNIGKLDLEVLKNIKHLAKPTEVMLMSGGDTRLVIDKKKLLNQYGCRPFPRPEAFSFSSSTASSISNFSFNMMQNIRINLIFNALNESSNETCNQVLKDIKFKLSNYLGGGNKKIILAPSGTDIALFFSGLFNKFNGGRVQHLLVGADETGSGVPLALQGMHFAPLTASNVKVSKGELIDGYINRKIKKINVKDANGTIKIKNQLDKEVDAAVKSIIDKNIIPILHIIDQSKLGIVAPSFSLVEKLSTKYKGKIIFQVDNSQMRMKKEKVLEYMKMDSCFMTITGSKFYTGPPFSGALIFPKNYKDFLNKSKLPSGLKQYFSLDKLNTEAYIEDNLNINNLNFGLVLRWLAAIEEIKRYENVPESLKLLGSSQFNKHVFDIIKNCSFLEYLENNQDNKGYNSIHPFYIIKNGKVLSHEDCKFLYRLLNDNISHMLPKDINQEHFLAQRKCHIGQPVKIGHHSGIESAVLRINLGSRVISDSWKEKDTSIFFQEIEKQLIQIEIIVNKIELILKYWDTLKNEELKL